MPTTRPTRWTDSWTTKLKTVGHFQSVRFGLHENVFRFECLRTNKAKRRTNRTGPASATSGSTISIRSGPLHQRLRAHLFGGSWDEVTSIRSGSLHQRLRAHLVGGSWDEVTMGGVAWGGVGLAGWGVGVGWRGVGWGGVGLPRAQRLRGHSLVSKGNGSGRDPGRKAWEIQEKS